MIISVCKENVNGLGVCAFKPMTCCAPYILASGNSVYVHEIFSQPENMHRICLDLVLAACTHPHEILKKCENVLTILHRIAL